MRPDVSFARPEVSDASSMWQMAREAGLDENSPYKYLVFARDFAASSLLARDSAGPVGFVTGYLRPAAPDTLFVWQIGVLERARGRGVGGQMLEWLVRETRARHLEATVTPDNAPSNALFSGFAARRGVPWHREMLFPSDVFPSQLHSQHEPEVLIRIGPFVDRAETRTAAAEHQTENTFDLLREY